jgi:hypothetical protein
MNATQLKEKLSAGALGRYAHLYADLDAQSRRYADAIDAFTALYGDDRELYLFSVPGRSELSGNHTDHQHGRVLAGAIDRDIIAVVRLVDKTVKLSTGRGLDCFYGLSRSADKPKIRNRICCGYVIDMSIICRCVGKIRRSLEAACRKKEYVEDKRNRQNDRGKKKPRHILLSTLIGTENEIEAENKSRRYAE